MTRASPRRSSCSRTSPCSTNTRWSRLIASFSGPGGRSKRRRNLPGTATSRPWRPCAGDLEAAKKSVELSKKLGWSAGGRALNDLATAMIELRQGRGRSAMQNFRLARAVYRHGPTAHFQSDLVLTDWLEFEVLRKEIEGPLEDAIFPDDPFAGGMRAGRGTEKRSVWSCGRRGRRSAELRRLWIRLGGMEPG